MSKKQLLSVNSMNLDLKERLIKLLKTFYFTRGIIYVKRKDACCGMQMHYDTSVQRNLAIR